MDEITLIDSRGWDLSETIPIDGRLYYAKHKECQLCGDPDCIQYWVEGNGVAKCELPILNDVMIYGKLFGRCLECRIEDPTILYFYRPRFDLFLLNTEKNLALRMDRYDPNRDSIISDLLSIRWDKIK
jgi:hypothetical protein